MKLLVSRFRNLWIYLSVAGVQSLSLIRNYKQVPECSRLVEVTSQMRVLVNCDSATFMKDAQDPTRIISGVSDYQDRPLYSILAHFISKLWDLSNLPTRNFLVIGNSGLSFNYKSDVYVAFVLINLTLLLLTVWLTLKICSEIFMLVEMPEINQRIVQITFVFLAISDCQRSLLV